MLCLSIGLSGCISQGQKPTALPTSTTSFLLDKDWRVEGKLGIRQTENSALNNSANPTGGTKKSAYSLRFEWQQQGQDYTARLSGALGFGRVVVEKQANSVSLSRGKNTVQADDVDQLFYQQTGWELPVSMLRYWALGLPSPNKPFKLNHQQSAEPTTTIAGFKQDGWQVNYSKSEQISRFRLPAKMTAIHPDLKLVMAFKGWQLPDNLLLEDTAATVQAAPLNDHANPQ